MARRVYIHIGLPKTGTTFLQTTMWHNRGPLGKQDFLYPGRQRFDHYYAYQQVRRRPHPGDPYPEGAWERLRAELSDWPGVGLVSHEFFSMATRKQVARLIEDLAPAEVHVVVTARSYVRQFPAVWQEALKMGVDSSFDEFMEDLFADRLSGAWSWDSQDLPAVLARWRSAVPAERIHIVTVPPPGSPRDLLWRRWCTALEIDDSGFDLEVSRPNQSLGAQQAALLRRLKPRLSGSLLEGSVRHRWVRRYFGHEVLVPQGGDRFSPRPEHREVLLRRSRRARRTIRRGGYAVYGELRDLRDSGTPGPGPHPDDVTTEEMLDVATRAIEQMIHDVKDLTIERDDLLQARARGGLVRRLASRLRRREQPDPKEPS